MLLHKGPNVCLVMGWFYTEQESCWPLSRCCALFCLAFLVQMLGMRCATIHVTLFNIRIHHTYYMNHDVCCNFYLFGRLDIYIYIDRAIDWTNTYCIKVNDNKTNIDQSIMNPCKYICIGWNLYSMAFNVIYEMLIYFKNGEFKKVFISLYVHHIAMHIGFGFTGVPMHRLKNQVLHPSCFTVNI